MTSKELKSKVMTLGKKLAPRVGGDRRAAFVEAWVIVKAGCLELAVRGVSFGNRQEALRRLAAYSPAAIRAALVPEPENPADPAAVAVMVGVQGGRGLYRLGYVPRTLAPVVAALGGPGRPTPGPAGSVRDPGLVRQDRLRGAAGPVSVGTNGGPPGLPLTGVVWLPVTK
jgi:hypothetical protein